MDPDGQKKIQERSSLRPSKAKGTVPTRCPLPFTTLLALWTAMTDFQVLQEIENPAFCFRSYFWPPTATRQGTILHSLETAITTC
jgi:hypothetical protein